VRVCSTRLWRRSRTSIASRRISEVTAALVLGQEECPCSTAAAQIGHYAFVTMSTAKRTNKPQNRAVPRRLSATLRAARVTKALRLSDLEWRALQSGGRRKRRAAYGQLTKADRTLRARSRRSVREHAAPRRLLHCAPAIITNPHTMHVSPPLDRLPDGMTTVVGGSVPSRIRLWTSRRMSDSRSSGDMRPRIVHRQCDKTMTRVEPEGAPSRGRLIPSVD